MLREEKCNEKKHKFLKPYLGYRSGNAPYFLFDFGEGYLNSFSLCFLTYRIETKICCEKMQRIG